MSDKEKKEGPQRNSKIDLGLESLLAAMGANDTAKQTMAAEAEPIRDQDLAEVPTDSSPSFEVLYAKGQYQELEFLCLDRLKESFDLEAKLWWIRSVHVRKGLPVFLLEAPYEEVRALAVESEEFLKKHKKLLATVGKELGVSPNEAADKAITPIKSASPSEDVSANSEKAEPKTASTSEPRRIRIEPKTAAVVLIFCLLVGLFIYRQFPALTSATDYASRVIATEDRRQDPLNEAVEFEQLPAQNEATEASNGSAVLQKIREDQRQLEQGASEEQQESQKKDGLRIDDILDLVNEDPELRFEERVRKQDRAEESNKPKSKGIDKIKEELEPSRKGRVRDAVVDVTGPLEPEEVTRILDKVDEKPGVVVFDKPQMVDAFSMAGYQVGPRKSATKSLVITKPGKVYTNTSAYAVEIEDLKPGDEVWLLENQGAWLKIASREGEVGFIDAQLVS